jgi:hypothetical protein
MVCKTEDRFESSQSPSAVAVFQIREQLSPVPTLEIEGERLWSMPGFNLPLDTQRLGQVRAGLGIFSRP